MGGAIAISLAACLNNVEKLVVVDGFGPITRPEEAAAQHLRACIQHRLRMRDRGMRTFDSMEHAVKARLDKVATYPGVCFACILGFKRGLQRVFHAIVRIFIHFPICSRTKLC